MSEQDNNSSKEPRDFKIVLVYIALFGFFMFKGLMSTPTCNGGAVETGKIDAVFVDEDKVVAMASDTLDN